MRGGGAAVWSCAELRRGLGAPSGTLSASKALGLFVTRVVMLCSPSRLLLAGVRGLFFFQAEDGIRDLVRSRGLGDVYKRQVNHSIVSQTNPLAVPFISANRIDPNSLWDMSARHLGQLAKTNSIFAIDIIERLTGNKSAKLAIHKVRSIIDQQYVGNINILPKRQIRNLSQVLYNPTRESINQLIVSGERASWPQLHVIKRNTKISENLRYHLGQLKKREAVELGHEVR